MWGIICLKEFCGFERCDMSLKVTMNQSILIVLSIALAVVTRSFVFNKNHPAAEQKGNVLALKTAGDEAASPDKTADTRRDVLIDARHARPAPALSDGTWINSEPLTLAALRGRVVVVDFWTFGCYNCRNTLPALKRWNERYREQGLTIVGVHSPEFDREKNSANVRDEVRSLGLRYPVLTDNDYETWRAFGVEAWPTTVILDKQGRIRWTHIGEGMYDEMENVIRKLLAEER
jgi:thiol-disulfide isomerase/thioredoxin